MKKLAPLIHDTENGLDYILVGEIYLPLIAVPEETRDIGFYGSLRRNYVLEMILRQKNFSFPKEIKKMLALEIY